MFWVPAGYIAARRVQDTTDERLSSPYDVPVPVTSSLKPKKFIGRIILECTATGVFGDLASLSALAEVVPNAIMEPLMSSATGHRPHQSLRLQGDLHPIYHTHAATQTP